MKKHISVELEEDIIRRGQEFASGQGITFDELLQGALVSLMPRKKITMEEVRRVIHDNAEESKKLHFDDYKKAYYEMKYRDYFGEDPPKEDEE